MSIHLDHAYKLGGQLATFEKQADLFRAMARVGKHMDKAPINPIAAEAEILRRTGAVLGTIQGGLGGLAGGYLASGVPGALIASGVGGVGGNLIGRGLGTAAGTITGSLRAAPGIRHLERALSKPVLR